MSISRTWLFRILVIVAGVVIMASFVMPWWAGKFDAATGIWIYGWGLRHNLEELAAYAAQDATPLYQTILAWVYAGISVVLLLYSTFIKHKIAALVQAFVGIAYIAYALIAVYVVVADRIKGFNIALQGRTVLGNGLFIQCSIQPGFYLALAAGAFIVILAIIRFMLARNHTN